MDKKNKHGSSSEGEDDYVEEIVTKPKEQKKPRSSVSAEVYGSFNKKEEFVPRVIPKSQDQIKRIEAKLNNFMFSALDEKEQQIIVNAMEIKSFKQGDWVIKQGEDGDLLYVIETGTLKCFKKFAGKAEDTYLKTYQPGESFGELALLYNAPRAASIQADSVCQLFALDRECFNRIVKDAAFKKRERYDKFLLSVELLQSMDPYERVKIADALTSVTYEAGSYLMKQGETGSTFYLLEEGEASAMKVLKEGEKEQEVLKYKQGDYFGELALLNDQPRQASVIAKTKVKVVGLDRDSFKRLIGPLDDILKRNMEKYKKFM